MKNKSSIEVIIAIAVAAIIVYGFLVYVVGGAPFPRGRRVDPADYSYYKNIKGIYYISVENPLALVNYGHCGYLEGADESTFTILGDLWSKDATHVWYEDQLIDNVDAGTFHLNPSGVPVDKDHVYIMNYSLNKCYLQPAESGIDLETAEYFVCLPSGFCTDKWMRDKDYVYYYDKRVDVDRNSFQIYGEDWFIDKNFVYKVINNAGAEHWELRRLDSIQAPIEADNGYFRNGRNIIYWDSVIVRDIDVQRFESIGVSKQRVNDLLFYEGKPFLKDTLDVKNARFYYYGHIAADSNYVYYGNNRLDGIDAPTFRQINEDKYEDKNFIYTLKDSPWDEDYPFRKKKEVAKALPLCHFRNVEYL